MKILIRAVYVGVITLALLLSAQTLKATGTGIEPIFSFNSSGTAPHGNFPTDPLIQANDGNFYGTTQHGGPHNDGTVFKITANGMLTTLASFNGTNGAFPVAGLIQASDGNFYGTAQEGGANNDGVVFKVTPTGVLTVLASFNGTKGANPNGGLVEGSDGNFYGTASNGGANSDGTVFKITPSGTLTRLASFNGTNKGAEPLAGLVLGRDGNFYGTTEFGGANNEGVVFKITPSGTLTRLVSFNGTNGAAPLYGALIQASDGKFYGTTEQGGANGDGTVFKITSTGVLTVLASFNGANGEFPFGGVIQASDGNFYGTAFEGGANDDGVVFEVTPNGVLTALASFDDSNTGGFPEAGLVQGSDLLFYGTASNGGANDGGTVYRVVPAYQN